MDNDAREVLSRVARLATDVGPALTPAGYVELVESIAAAARKLFRAQACSIALLDESSEELEFHVASGAGAGGVVGVRVPAGTGIAGWVVASGEPIAITDVTRDPRFAGDVAERTGYVPRSIVAMPLETDHAIIGVIEVLDPEPDAGDDMETLSLFARQAALAIENSRVFSNLGAALFTALARLSDDADLTSALEAISQEAGAPSPELAELAACFHELGTRGDEERRAATMLVTAFLDYVRRGGKRG